MFEEVFIQIMKYTFLDWLQFTGALIAFILAIIKCAEFWKNRVRLNISLQQERFVSQTIQDYDTYHITEIEIGVDLKNKGLEPTSISGVEFHSNIKGLQKVDAATALQYTLVGRVHNFEKIRVDSNDRIKFMLYVKKNILLSDKIKSLDATLIFKTTHKDISKHITLHRREN